MASKPRERLLLNEWARLTQAIDPDLALDCERPDFLITGKSETLGIEITEFAANLVLDARAARAQAALRDRLLNAAHTLYSAASDQPLYVGVDFAPDFVLTKDRILDLARKLTAFLQSIDGDLGRADVPQAWNYRPSPLDGIDSVVAIRVAPDYAERWHVQNWGPSRTVAFDEIVAIVREKESKLTGYLERCERAWLIIAFDRQSAGDLVHPPSESGLRVLSTSFKRVSCFHWVTGKVVEIPLA